MISTTIGTARQQTCSQMMHGRGQAERARVNQGARARREHRAEHVDQACHSAANASHGPADLLQHAGDGDGTGVDHGRRPDPPHLVHEARIIGGQPRDLRLDRALGQAAAQPFDQPGAERVQLGHLGNVDEDALRTARELLGVSHHPLQDRREARGPGSGGAECQRAAFRNPFQLRIAAQDVRSRAGALETDEIRWLRTRPYPEKVSPTG
ncbi:hypothetical protein ACVWZZ_000978 [Bradyrhizobium sp. LM6.10]